MRVMAPSSASDPSPPVRAAESNLLNGRSSIEREGEDVFLNGLHKRARKPALSATHELRALRADSARMEKELESLCHKWRTHLPEHRVRKVACATAKAKWTSMQAEYVNRSLKDQLLQQQLYLASLQHLITQSPFLGPARSKELFEGMHTFISLSASQTTAQRVTQLKAQCELDVRLASALMNRFARNHLKGVTPQNPFSHTSIMADNHYTYVSNILLCKIPHRSLDASVRAALVYFRNLSSELQLYLGVQCDLKELYALDSISNYSQARYRNGPTIAAASNVILAAKFAPNQAVLTVDFVDQDELHPTNDEQDGDVMRDSCLSLVMTTERDPVTGQEYVLVQRLSVNRYNLAPQSPKMLDEIRSTLPWFNGDLFTKVMCHELEHGAAPTAEELAV